MFDSTVVQNQYDASKPSVDDFLVLLTALLFRASDSHVLDGGRSNDPGPAELAGLWSRSGGCAPDHSVTVIVPIMPCRA